MQIVWGCASDDSVKFMVKSGKKKENLIKIYNAGR